MMGYDGRVCVRVRTVDRDQNREHERAQIGHGWSVRSPFQTTPYPLPATFYRTHFLSLSLFPSLSSFLFRLSSLILYLHLSLEVRIAVSVRLCPPLARPVPIDLSSTGRVDFYRSVSLGSSFCRSSHLSIHLACSSTRAPFQNY